LLLSLCSFKCISYAADRNKIFSILIALFVQAGGAAALLYVAWSLAPL
jgi:hypothetical protein